jgi:hypothetical protein
VSFSTRFETPKASSRLTNVYRESPIFLEVYHKPFQGFHFGALLIGMARKKSIKSMIPWELHIALIKLQGRLESTYEEACIRASQLLDINSTEFEKAVATKIRNIMKSQVMSKVNKSRKTWTDKGYKKGYREGHRQGYQKGVAEYKITYSCSVCGEELVMMPDNKDHLAMKNMMINGGWAHSSCHEAKKRK